MAQTRTMPSLTRIADWWMRDGHAAVFPNLMARAIGWGEPFCFRCGWLSPEPGHIAEIKLVRDPWKHARGWLERAHLAERCSGGADMPDNLAPLCSLCHRQMPEAFGTRQAGIAWINSWDASSLNPFWQAATDLNWGGDSYRAFPGTKAFLNLRLQADDYHRHAVIESRNYARQQAA